MKLILAAIILFCSLSVGFGQLTTSPEEFLSSLKGDGPIPEKLLSERSAVFYPSQATDKELEQMQKSFQSIGVDAVAYFKIDLIGAGYDVSSVLSDYITKRDIQNLIFMKKENGMYSLSFASFNGKPTLVNIQQPVWIIQGAALAELLKNAYRILANSQTNKNLLILDYPEKDLSISPIQGKRSEFFAIDMKVDKTAIPLTGNKAIDEEIKKIFEMYHLKHEFVSPAKSERDMRAEGNMYVLRFIYAPVAVARNLLGYEDGKSESAYVSVTFPGNQEQLKSITVQTPVYKFYFKHIPSGNVFLGTKWDADTTWQQSLINHITAFKAELRLE